jgi:hypothetical protein
MRSVDADMNTRINGLTRWVRGSDEAAMRAAGGLVLGSRHWLYSKQFHALCTNEYEGVFYIDWAATDYALKREDLLGSSGEIALLKWAVVIARDLFGASSLDRNNREAVLDALAAGWGMTR